MWTGYGKHFPLGEGRDVSADNLTSADEAIPDGSVRDSVSRRAETN